MKYQQFLEIAAHLNEKLSITPLLFGSLGLQQRLGCDLQPDDIDILIPARYLHEDWQLLESAMEALGYTLYDLHEHAFQREGVSAAFASIESLEPFAGVDYRRIPSMTDGTAHYLLLELEDYLRVYTQSAKDGYRADRKHKDDTAKIQLIRRALGERSN